MSVKIMGLVWDIEMPREEKFVLLAYADHAHHDGTGIYPAVATIASKTGYSERSVQDITRRLEEAGWLIPDGKGPMGTNRWRFPVEGVQKLHPAETAPVQKTAEGGAENRGEGVQPTAPEPSLRNVINHPLVGGLSDKDYEQANAKVDALLESSRRPRYANREKFPEVLVEYADCYNELTGQEPVKRVLTDWLAEFSAWQSEGIRPENVRAAFEQLKSRGITVVRPGSLTNTAAAMKAQGKVSAQRRVERDPFASLRRSMELKQKEAE